MFVEELQANIDIILAQPDPRSYYDLSNIKGAWLQEGTYIAQPVEVQMVNERVEALRLLYAQATPEEQAAFPGLLASCLAMRARGWSREGRS